MAQTDPKLQIVPSRQAVATDAGIALDVLIRVVPPAPEVHVLRPPINLGLVLDHSGSMASGRKIEHAREAAAFAVRSLLPTDRVSVTIFDDEVTTLIASTPATDKDRIERKIRGIEPDGSTALHAGWAEGSRQVLAHRDPRGLNRVLLLSDGLANVGLTDPQAITDEVKGALAHGASTTAIGVGDDYNEDLLEAMAAAGDGNYYYVESSKQLADLFQTELQGLMATTGKRVSLGIEPRPGVAVLDVLNDLPKNPNGRLMLPNLAVGMPVDVVVRLAVSEMRRGGEILGVRLAWDEPGHEGRRSLRVAMKLVAIHKADWDKLEVSKPVAEAVALLEVARLKKRATEANDRGDRSGSAELLGQAKGVAAAAPATAATQAEILAISQLETALDKNLDAAFRKSARYQNYTRSRNRPAT